MNRGKTLLVILIAAFGMAWQTPFGTAEQFTPLLKVSAENVYLTAGEENVMEITLKNVGSFDVFEVEAFLSVPSTTTGISILEGGHRIFNSIKDGTSRTYSILLYVDRDTPLGSYSLTFEVSYLKQYKIGNIQAESKTVQLGVVVEKVAIPTLGLDAWMEAFKLSSGIKEKASIGIENIGNETIYELDVRVTSTSPHIVILDGAKLTHEHLVPGESTVFNPSIAVSRHAPIGVYTITTTVSYKDGDGREYQESFTHGVTVDSVLVEKQTSIVLRAYSTLPEIVNPGDTVDLMLDLSCQGAKAYDVKAKLSLDPLVGISTLSPTLVSLGDLEPDESVGTGFRLIMDGGLLAGQYPATVTLSYLDVDGVPRSLMEAVTLSVRGIVEFTLINDGHMAVAAGGGAELEADLLLVGTESVRFVSVEVVEDATFLGTYGSEEYIGAVDPDSPIPFDLNVNVADDADPGEKTLRLKITYTDDLNQEHETTIELPVTVEEPTHEREAPGGSGGFWAWLRRLLGLGP